MTEVLAWIADLSLLLMSMLLFLLLFMAKEMGYYVGYRNHRRVARRTQDEEGAPETVRTSVGFITGGMLALLAFLLAIALSIADARYEERRDVVLAEANAIGTAWLRAAAQDSEAGMIMQRLLEEYAEVRIQAVEASPFPEDQAPILARTATLQDEIWAIASTVARDAPTPISAQLLASVNEVVDLALSQRRAFEAQVPLHIFRMLLWMSLLAIAALGFNLGLLGSHQLVLSSLLILMWTSAIILISDISRPGQGWVDVSPDPLVWTVEQMRQSAK
jgi:hypothetical protein